MEDLNRGIHAFPAEDKVLQNSDLILIGDNKDGDSSAYPFVSLFVATSINDLILFSLLDSSDFMVGSLPVCESSSFFVSMGSKVRPDLDGRGGVSISINGSSSLKDTIVDTVVHPGSLLEEFLEVFDEFATGLISSIFEINVDLSLSLILEIEFTSRTRSSCAAAHIYLN